MSKTWKPLAEAVAHEKNLPLARVEAALAAALASLVTRKASEPGEARVEEILEEEPVAWFRPESSTGPWVRVELPELTRTAAQWVKQALHQNLRQELREQAYLAWQPRQGELVRGVVKRRDFLRIHVDLGNGAEGVLLREDRLPGDFPKPGAVLTAVVDRVTREGNDPAVRLSRTSPRFLEALFEQEVPEVSLGQVAIRAVARRAGVLAKVAVEAAPGFRGDAIAACVGMRGFRIQAVTRELGNERLELLHWHDARSEMLAAALGREGLCRMVLDENRRQALVGVEPTQMARVVGRGGVNVALAGKLLGWQVEAMPNADLDARLEHDDRKAATLLAEALDLDLDLAMALVGEGLADVETLAAVGVAELQTLVEGLDGETAALLWERSTQAARRNALARHLEEETRQAGLASLLQLGLTPDQARALMEQGVESIEALADQSVLDILPWKGVTEAQLGQWIIAARDACWAPA